MQVQQQLLQTVLHGLHLYQQTNQKQKEASSSHGRKRRSPGHGIDMAYPGDRPGTDGQKHGMALGSNLQALGPLAKQAVWLSRLGHQESNALLSNPAQPLKGKQGQ